VIRAAGIRTEMRPFREIFMRTELVNKLIEGKKSEVMKTF